MPVEPAAGALPNLIVIGAMKCGTTALHRYLDAHPEIAMASAKEVNFFVGAEVAPPHGPGDDPAGGPGRWHRGWDWYATLFDPSAPVRGESSPGYTSPDHPDVAARMAAGLPDVRLVYLVRDPVRRAVSQYRHHRRDGDERRPLAEAVLDPGSQYVARSRYHERLQPFLRHFPAKQILVVVQERLLAARRAELARVYAHAGADPHWWDAALQQRWHVGDEDAQDVPADLRQAFAERVYDDVDRLRAFMGDDLPEWTL
jgi:hypothetical protein